MRSRKNLTEPGLKARKFAGSQVQSLLRPKQFPCRRRCVHKPSLHAGTAEEKLHVGRLQAAPPCGATMRRRDKWLIAVVVVIVVLVAIRAAMPTVIRDYVNDQLQALEQYDGQVEDIDLSLLRGAYAIDNIRIVKTGGKQPVPFFSAN